MRYELKHTGIRVPLHRKRDRLLYYDPDGIKRWDKQLYLLWYGGIKSNLFPIGATHGVGNGKTRYSAMSVPVLPLTPMDYFRQRKAPIDSPRHW